jgi:hypothetical protein
LTIDDCRLPISEGRELLRRMNSRADTGVGHAGNNLSDGRRRRRTLIGGATVLAVFAVLCEAKLWRPSEVFTGRENIQIAEAQAWWKGRLDLPEREWDSALINGRVYSHFPPMFTLIAAVTAPCFGGVPHWVVLLVVVLPVPLLAYALCLRRTGSAAWGAVLAVGLVFGTSAYPVIDKTLRGARPYPLNQTLAVVGLLILLIEFYGRGRTWLMGVGVTVAALSRQLTVAYAIPFIWSAFRRGTGRPTVGAIPGVALTGAITLGLPLTLNALKFGTPFEPGYRYVYVGREEDALARDAREHGIFSPWYVPRNLYYANVGLPVLHTITSEGHKEWHLRPNHMGTGIWWTTPLLLWVFVELRRICREPGDRKMLLGAALAYAALLFYHSTGFDQRGFNRYSLDYVPVLLALVAPTCCIGWRRWVSLTMVGWSVLYFRWLI